MTGADPGTRNNAADRMASASSPGHGVGAVNLAANPSNESMANRSGCNPNDQAKDPARQRPSAKMSDKSSRTIRCRFFTAKKGCRAGDTCPYLHDAAALLPVQMSLPQGPTGEAEPTASAALEHTAVASPQIVSKPIPPAQQLDPRLFEIKQLGRRFSILDKKTADATILTFPLVPTDPDFPFELSSLKCALTVPNGYPKDARPSLRVSNDDMERGYQINIERGFDALVAQYPTKTLLEFMNELDKRLEGFLVSEKAQTIKFIPNATKKVPDSVQQPAHVQTITHISQNPDHPVQVYAASDKELASARRSTELRQLEARLGRSPLYSKAYSDKNAAYDLPLPVKLDNLPTELRSIKTVRLAVPELYSLEPCTIRFRDSDAWAARSVETEFERHVREHPEMTLMAHFNYLSQNMHKMIHERSKEGPGESETTLEAPIEHPLEKQELASDENSGTLIEPDDRPHVKFIQRPPEWDNVEGVSDDDEGFEYSGSEDDYPEEEEEGGAPLPDAPESERKAGPERGVMVSFPQLEMYGIELLEIAALSVTVKCDRCKEVLDINNVQSSTKAANSATKSESCKKCASQLSITYRGEPMHANSIRAGYLDLDGCTTVDMLPSSFQPTCSQCSTTYTASPIISVRGETSLAICRECHQKMSFKLPEVKFLRVSNEGRSNRPLPPRRRPKESLGLVAGTELPGRGRCAHYAKSYRWFRFGCCAKVYPCDRCHDEKEQHPNEHAPRMICGWCSREQPYRPEECGFCGRGVVGRKGGGFWEGGKGTRDRVRMSRKDPRKWKRRRPGAGGPSTGGDGGK